MTIEIRTHVSPPDAPIELAEGKLPPAFHVNVITTLVEDGQPPRQVNCHRVAYQVDANLEFRRGAEPDPRLEAALVAAEPRTLALWGGLVQQFGVMDCTLTISDTVLNITSVKSGDTFSLTKYPKA